VNLHASAFRDLQRLETHGISRQYRFPVVLLSLLDARSPFTSPIVPIPKITGQSSIIAALEARNFNGYCLPTGILMRNGLPGSRSLSPAPTPPIIPALFLRSFSRYEGHPVVMSISAAREMEERPDRDATRKNVEDSTGRKYDRSSFLIE